MQNDNITIIYGIICMQKDTWICIYLYIYVYETLEIQITITIFNI